MRGLNLSKLARASESSFFKNEQAAQAARLRERLAGNDAGLLLKNSSQHSSPSPRGSAGADAASADVLMEIAAHGVYRKLAQSAPKVNVIKMGARPLSQSHDTVHGPHSSLMMSNTKHSSCAVAPDANILRALGPARLAVFEQVSRNARHMRALPGSDKYAEGAALGILSFGVATMIVASVGLAGGIVLCTKPGIIESWKTNTMHCRNRLDDLFGEQLRRFTTNMSEKSRQVLSDEQRDRASHFARTVVKPPPRVSTTVPETQRNDSNRLE